MYHFGFRNLKNALRLFTNVQYFAVHSKWPSVGYLENAFGHVPLVGNEQTRNCQLFGPLHVQGHEKQVGF